MADARPTINARDLFEQLKILPPDKSVLLIAPHGVGKSEISAQIAEYFNLPLIDRRLAQMTEGDMIGMPIVTGKVTQYLPVDWFMQACDHPAQVLLDELNRATTEIANGAFQIVLDRELNGNKLHPMSRVIACVNFGAHYSVNEMDPALINRFAIYHFDPDHTDWITWATTKMPDGNQRIDPIMVDYIKHHPNELRFKDLDKMEPMTAYPTPRGWAAVDKCLKYAKMAPSDVCGATTPDSFFHMVASMLGHPAAIGFTKWVREYSKVVTAADVLDRWDKNEARIKLLTHDAHVGVLDKIGEHATKNTWTQDQMNNLVKFGQTCLTGEDFIILFAKVTSAKNMTNIKLWHASPLLQKVLEVTNAVNNINNSIKK